MTQLIIVLSASQYRIFVKDKDGNDTDVVDNEGTTVRYLLTDNLLPYVEPPRAMGVIPPKGRVPAKVTMPYEDYDKYEALPAFYTADIEFSTDSKGNVKVIPTGLVFSSGITVSKSAGVKLNRSASEVQ